MQRYDKNDPLKTEIVGILSEFDSCTDKYSELIKPTTISMKEPKTSLTFERTGHCLFVPQGPQNKKVY